MRAESLYVVDCLLPAPIRKLGRAMTYLGPRRAVKTSAVDCEIRGGEYVAYDRSDYATALKVWLPLAQDGDRVAQVYVGEIYEKGLGIAPDYALAAAWYRKAAEQGDARAQINLGHLYEKGLGVDRDPATALSWYRKASGLAAVALDAGSIDTDTRAEVRQLRAELDRMTRQAESLRERRQEAEALLTETRRELETGTRAAVAARRSFEQAQHELERLRQQTTGARSAEEVKRLEEQLTRRQAESEAQRQDVEHLRQRLSTLETEAEGHRRQLAELNRARVAVAGPTIEVIEPAVVATRGVAVVRVANGAGAPVERVIVGKVTAPAGLMLFAVNDHEERLDENGLFRTRIPVGREGAAVKLVAVDKQGRRQDVEFRLAIEESPTPPPAKSRPKLQLGTYHALIIGNRNYAYWPSLKTSEADALKTAELLRTKYGFKTKVLINARRVEILQALNELRNQLTDKDNLLIYYAGHGYLDEKINRAYWIPIDGELDSNVEWISTVAITDLVGAISAKHVLLVVDSCYSGALTRSALARLEAGTSDEAREHWLQVVASKRSRTVLSSGDVKPVLDMGGGEHSVFARAWLDVLRTNQGVLEGQRIYREIATRVAYAADALKFEQVPQYAPIKFAGHESGDFLFVAQTGGSER
ncbi:MAG: caspase family protein [Candidatus Rokuibacteriota bacterium]